MDELRLKEGLIRRLSHRLFQCSSSCREAPVTAFACTCRTIIAMQWRPKAMEPQHLCSLTSRLHAMWEAL